MNPFYPKKPKIRAVKTARILGFKIVLKLLHINRKKVTTKKNP